MMDFSREYINMADCPEIQIKPCIPSPMGYINDKQIHFDINGSFWVITQQRQIWLPRQDELQEMVEYSRDNSLDKLQADFMDYCWDEETDSLVDDTLEKCWIRFVMNRNYGRDWIGEWAQVGRAWI